MPGPKKYEEILDEYRRTGQLYEDPEFPPTDKVGPLGEALQWKRPHEICSTPNFTVDDAKRSHFVQGDLENCWFVSAIGSLTSAKNHLRSVCASEHHSKEEQAFDQTNGHYCGAFSFRFWQYDRWTEVIVDDRLPIAMDGRRPAFLHSEDGDEFLGPLVEKAYAKLNGSYEALRAGHAAEALADLTAGWVDFVRVSEAEDQAEVISRIRDALRKNTQVVASITEESFTESRRMGNGLTINHGYVVIDCREVMDNAGQEVCLLHLRDPKAKGGWNGAWSRDSEQWANLPEETKTALQGTPNEPAEFWISSDDFLQNITTVEICNGADVAENHGRAIAGGEWKAGSSDDTFYEDPQFEMVVIPGADQPQVTFTLELTQVGRRRLGRPNLAIKFRVFALEDNAVPAPLDRNQLDEMTSISARKMYANSRSFAERFTAGPGRFVVVVSTESTDEAARFTLRLLSDSPECSIIPAPS